jgi:adenine-specific DNA-methyltransferase
MPRSLNRAPRSETPAVAEVLQESLRRQIQLAGELAGNHPAMTAEELLAAVRQAAVEALFTQIGPGRATPAEADPLSPLPAEILGRVYEQFLGKTFRRNGRRVTVCRQSESRKAAGVYYTPGYIVNYIVDQTLGAWLQGKTLIQAQSLTILDPACGCGGFLIAAYRYLLHWFEQRYLEADAAGDPSPLCRTPAGNWALSVPERLAILHRSIFGVDLDLQAVDITRRSLLWVACTEADPGVPPSLSVPQELAELEANIRPGNALDTERFDWQRQFAAVFAGPNPGFAVMLGNPPYRRELAFKAQLDALAGTPLGRKYRAPRMDLWYYFLHLALDQLLHQGGLLSFITNSYWLTGRGATKLVAQLQQEAQLDELFDLGSLRVFPAAHGRHIIFRLRKDRCGRQTTRIKLAPAAEKGSAEPYVDGRGAVACFEKTAPQLFRDGRLDLQPPADRWLAKLDHFPILASLGRVRQGIAENPATVNAKTNRRHGNRWRVGQGVFALTPAELQSLALPAAEQTLLRPYHDLCDLDRYGLAAAPSRRLIYSTKHTCADITGYPRLHAHLAQFQPIMDLRRETRQGKIAWWHLHWPRDEAVWQAAKIVALQMVRRPSFVPAGGPLYVPFSVNVWVPAVGLAEHFYYIAGLLNSRVLWKWYQHTAKHRGINLEINGHVLGRTPIRRIDFALAADRRRHDRMVELVGEMLALGQPADAGTPLRCRQMETVDQEIDRLTYELYDLDAAEIALVEANTVSIQ